MAEDITHIEQGSTL